MRIGLQGTPIEQFQFRRLPANQDGNGVERGSCDTGLTLAHEDTYRPTPHRIATFSKTGLTSA